MFTVHMDPHVGASDGGSGAGRQLALGKVLAEDGALTPGGPGAGPEDSAPALCVAVASGGKVSTSPDV